MSLRLPPALVALTPGDLAVSPCASTAASIERAVGAAFEAGLRGVVLREAGASDRSYLELARSLRRILDSAAGGWLCLHDRPHLARAALADAVHLGGRSLAAKEVRAWLDPSIALGLSTHASDDPATWRGADYLFHGPVRPTTKSSARAPIGFDGLARAVRSTARPIWALGGLEPEHARAIAAAGARGVAVLSGILPRTDLGARVRAYLDNCAVFGS